MSTPASPGGPPPTQAVPPQAPPPAAYPPGAYAPPPQQQQDGGPGMAERAQQAAQQFSRHVHTPETKEFFKTSEFLVWALTTIGLLIAAAVISGDSDNFLADEAWRYITIVSAAYIISRGLSKAGTRGDHGRHDTH